VSPDGNLSDCFSQVLPTIVYFSTVISILYYWGVMQVIVKWVAGVMQFAMGTTAGESLNAAGNIFIGQVRNVFWFSSKDFGHDVLSVNSKVF